MEWRGKPLLKLGEGGGDLNLTIDRKDIKMQIRVIEEEEKEGDEDCGDRAVFAQLKVERLSLALSLAAALSMMLFEREVTRARNLRRWIFLSTMTLQ